VPWSSTWHGGPGLSDADAVLYSPVSAIIVPSRPPCPVVVLTWHPLIPVAAPSGTGRAVRTEAVYASLDSVGPGFAIAAHLKRLFASEAPDGETTAGQAPVATPIPRTDADRERLAATNAARHDWFTREGQPDRTVTREQHHPLSDFRTSPTDPDAGLMQPRSGAHLGYLDQYVVDGGKARIILNALVTPADVTENLPMLDLLWRTCFYWKLRPHQATGDTTYATIENIVALEQAGIRAYLPLPLLREGRLYL
jgi:hypothetical protein